MENGSGSFFIFRSRVDDVVAGPGKVGAETDGPTATVEGKVDGSQWMVDDASVGEGGVCVCEVCVAEKGKKKGE